MKKVQALEDLEFDRKNANKGTARGRAMLEDSLRKFGAGRSILADREGRVIAGNKTLEVAADIGLPVRVIETDGSELVVVQRKDVDLESKQGRELAIADNRVAELDLAWDDDVLLELQAEGVDVEQFKFDLDKAGGGDVDDVSGVDPATQLRPAREYVVIMCADDGGAEWERLKVALDLQPVRRGGYRVGSPFEAVGTQRVVHAADLLARLEKKGDA